MPAWPHAVESIGMPGLHCHDLRHTGNTFASESYPRLNLSLRVSWVTRATTIDILALVASAKTGSDQHERSRELTVRKQRGVPVHPYRLVT